MRLEKVAVIFTCILIQLILGNLVLLLFSGRMEPISHLSYSLASIVTISLSFLLLNISKMGKFKRFLLACFACLFIQCLGPTLMLVLDNFPHNIPAVDTLLKICLIALVANIYLFPITVILSFVLYSFFNLYAQIVDDHLGTP